MGFNMKKAKRSVGRPPIKNNPKKQRMIYVSEDCHKFFKALGEGNFSLGIEKAHNKLKSIKANLETTT